MTDLTISNSGIRLAMSVFGRFELPPVLFLHGMANSRDTWNEMVSALSGTYQLWTLDFRGHGHSDHAAPYDFSSYVSDAIAALDAIGRRAAIVGHSLGGCVAGVLAQRPHPLIAGVFLEDPPWFLGEPGQWEKAIISKLYTAISTKQHSLQTTNAPLSAYLDFVSSSPSPLGGIASDHFSPRHLLSQASALQRQDNKCWRHVSGVRSSPLSVIETGKSFQCPVSIVRGDPHLGGVLLDGHEVRLASTNPHSQIIHYKGCGHQPHCIQAFEERFATDVREFLAGLTY